MISQWCKPQGNPHKSCPGQKHKSCCFHVTQQNKKGPSIPSKICRFCFAVSNQPQNHPLELTAITWSTILIPCPFVIGHTNTGSWIVGENSSTIQFPVLPSALVATCHWSPLQSAVQCPKHVRYVHNVVEMYHAVSGLQKRWSSILEDHSFWRWFWFDRRQGERLWSVTTDQAPFFFKLRRAKIGFDAFQRKALYCETRLVLKTLIPFSESESHDHFDNLAQIAGQMVWHRTTDNDNFLNLKKLSLLVSLCCTINDQSTIWKSDSTDWSSNANHKAKSAWLWLKSKLLD